MFQGADATGLMDGQVREEGLAILMREILTNELRDYILRVSSRKAIWTEIRNKVGSGDSTISPPIVSGKYRSMVDHRWL